MGRFGQEEEKEFTQEDEKWYDLHIPNDKVRDRAIEIHKTMNWQKIYDGLKDHKAFGRGTMVKHGDKRNLSMFLAMEDKKATSLVGVCDEVRGFYDWEPSGIGDIPPIAKGINCNVFLNGKDIGKVKEIRGNVHSTRKDIERKVLVGAIRDSEVVSEGFYDEDLGMRLGRETVSRYEGDVELENDTFGSGKFQLNGVHITDVKHRTDQSNVGMVFPCRSDKGFKCVNWVRFITKEDAKEEYSFENDDQIPIL